MVTYYIYSSYYYYDNLHLHFVCYVLFFAYGFLIAGGHTWEMLQELLILITKNKFFLIACLYSNLKT